MSVDVFGRQLDHIKSTVRTSGSRGPPGEGFKITTDGQYDMDHRRLCNLDDPVEENDATSLKIMRNIMRDEIRLIYNVTEELGGKVDSVETIVEGFQRNFLETMRRKSIDEEEVQNHLTNHFESIQRLTEELTTLKESITNETKLMLSGLHSIIKGELNTLREETNQELTLRNSEAIHDLDRRLIVLENGQESSNSRGAS